MEDRHRLELLAGLGPKVLQEVEHQLRKVSSVGEVRKKYLSPRCVSAGCEDSALTKGMPARSAAWLAAAVTEEK